MYYKISILQDYRKIYKTYRYRLNYHRKIVYRLNYHNVASRKYKQLNIYCDKVIFSS